MNRDFGIQPQLQAELDPGEKIVWSGQPARSFALGMKFLPSLIGLLPVAFILTTLFHQGTHVRSGQTLPLILLPLVWVAIVFLAPLLQFFSAGKTYYLITDRRALILVLGRTKRITSYLPGKLQSLERRERSNGTGDIVIERSPLGAYQRSSSYAKDLGFMNIPEVRRVEGLLRNLATAPVS